MARFAMSVTVAVARVIRVGNNSRRLDVLFLTSISLRSLFEAICNKGGERCEKNYDCKRVEEYAMSFIDPSNRNK